MNLYLVVSEPLSKIVYEDWFNQAGHEETYRLAELVVARNYSQARWLVWELEDTFGGDIVNMPRFAVRKKVADIEGPAQILNTAECQEFYKAYPKVDFWALGDAEHIGIREVA